MIPFAALESTTLLPVFLGENTAVLISEEFPKDVLPINNYLLSCVHNDNARSFFNANFFKVLDQSSLKISYKVDKEIRFLNT